MDGSGYYRKSDRGYLRHYLYVPALGRNPSEDRGEKQIALRYNLHIFCRHYCPFLFGASLLLQACGALTPQGSVVNKGSLTQSAWVRSLSLTKLSKTP